MNCCNSGTTWIPLLHSFANKKNCEVMGRSKRAGQKNYYECWQEKSDLHQWTVDKSCLLNFALGQGRRFDQFVWGCSIYNIICFNLFSLACYLFLNYFSDYITVLIFFHFKKMFAFVNLSYMLYYDSHNPWHHGFGGCELMKKSIWTALSWRCPPNFAFCSNAINLLTFL